MTKAVLLLLALSISPLLARGGGELLGFAPDRAKAEQQLEERFDKLVDPANLRASLKDLSARPHNVGSPYDRRNAERILAAFRSWGYDAAIEEFDVLFPTPKERVLEMLTPTPFTASLAELPVEGDSTTAQTSEQLPAYNAYSIDGDVTSELVYVNYGVPKDYDVLDERGIDVKGKIVLARYGGAWRGIKPKVAAEHGAIGCIIYSDPRDDGYYEGDVYPAGPYRNDHGAQRGSVADMPVYSGDPLTPFVGATKDAKRLPISEAKTLTKIPVLPISYSDALPLLRALTGIVAPDDWRGALPITYHIGPGPARVHLKVAFNWDIKPIYDVIARLKGSERPDEWIIRGNHHDAWVNGADDPLSGLVALLEEARCVGELARTGWKPKRTIIYAAWDGEEPGLLGSTEWVETHADELKAHAAVYINTDSNGRGWFGAGGSHALEKFVTEAARDVLDPETKVSIGERLRARLIMSGTPDQRKDARDRADLHIGALGSGSDYTPFIQHLGVSALSIGYGGEDGGGSYHSIYDSYSHFTRFVDPGFVYGATLAKTGGRLVLRLAGADVLPFEFNDAAETFDGYVREVTRLADDMRSETEEQKRRLEAKTFRLANDPTETHNPPKEQDDVPYLDFSPLQNAVASLKESAKEYGEAMKRLRGGVPGRADAQEALDRLLMESERVLTSPEGLPRRPWFVHEVYAPGLYTGYGVKTLPAVREAIEQRAWKEAGEQIRIAAAAIGRFSDQIARATRAASR